MTSVVCEKSDSTSEDNPFYITGSNYKLFCDGAEELGYSIGELKKKFYIEEDDIELGEIILPEWKGFPIIQTLGQQLADHVECICGVTIKDQYIIRSDTDKVAMVIGNTCITKFLPGEIANKIPEMKKNAERKKQLAKIEEQIKNNRWEPDNIIENYVLIGNKTKYKKEIDSNWNDKIDCCAICKNVKSDNLYQYLYNNNDSNEHNVIIVCCQTCKNKLIKKGLKKAQWLNAIECKRCKTLYKKILDENGICKKCRADKPCATKWCENMIKYNHKRPYCDNCYQQWRRRKGYD